MLPKSLIIPGVAPTGLIAGTRESRRARIVLEFEVSISGIGQNKTLERVRDADGRWVKVETLLRRMKALGGEPVSVEVGQPGKSTPIY